MTLSSGLKLTTNLHTKNEIAPALQKQGRGMFLFFVLQIVPRRGFRQHEGIQHKSRSQAEAGDESAVLRVDIAVIELLDKVFHIVSPSLL